MTIVIISVAVIIATIVAVGYSLDLKRAGFKFKAKDADGDGWVQDGTKIERRVNPVKKTAKKATPRKKAGK
jgi:hypothetical protein